MDGRITIVPLEAHHAHRAGDWFDEHSASVLLKSPTLKVGGESSHAHEPLAWAGLLNEEVAAVVTITVDASRTGWLNFAVAPSARRHGIASEVVEDVLGRSEVKALHHIRVHIDSADVGSQKVLDKCGFIKLGYSPEGKLEFELR